MAAHGQLMSWENSQAQPRGASGLPFAFLHLWEAGRHVRMGEGQLLVLLGGGRLAARSQEPRHGLAVRCHPALQSAQV